MTRRRVVLRVDADAVVGTGHAVRSLTLGAALRSHDFEVTVVSASLPDALAEQAAAEQMAVEVVSAETSWARIEQRRPDLVVVDGYHLAALVQRLVSSDLTFALIDDNHELPIEGASLILNQNLHATEALYADRAVAQRLLLGPRYVLLRAGVAGLKRRPPRERANRILVAIGGGDEAGHTESIVTELLRHREFHVCIGVGAANPRRADLLAVAARHPNRVRVDRGDLVESYAWADVAVIGAGTTMWEVGHLGLPAIAVVVAENQRAAAAAAADRGFIETVDGSGGPDTAELAERCAVLTADLARRQRMSTVGRELIDGQGPSRVAAEIESLLESEIGAVDDVPETGLRND
jgi:UDP-2,4-diacetamido-2,4,6-trideoxy-beta-L-altropyranose hydrolase